MMKSFWGLYSKKIVDKSLSEMSGKHSAELENMRTQLAHAEEESSLLRERVDQYARKEQVLSEVLIDVTNKAFELENQYKQRLEESERSFLARQEEWNKRLAGAKESVMQLQQAARETTLALEADLQKLYEFTSNGLLAVDTSVLPAAQKEAPAIKESKTEPQNTSWKPAKTFLGGPVFEAMAEKSAQDQAPITQAEQKPQQNTVENATGYTSIFADPAYKELLEQAQKKPNVFIAPPEKPAAADKPELAESDRAALSETPKEETPAYGSPQYAEPKPIYYGVQGAPAQGAPAQGAPAQGAPAEQMPAYGQDLSSLAPENPVNPAQTEQAPFLGTFQYSSLYQTLPNEQPAPGQEYDDVLFSSLPPVSAPVTPPNQSQSDLFNDAELQALFGNFSSLPPAAQRVSQPTENTLTPTQVTQPDPLFQPAEKNPPAAPLPFAGEMPAQNGPMEGAVLEEEIARSVNSDLAAVCAELGIKGEERTPTE